MVYRSSSFCGGSVSAVILFDESSAAPPVSVVFSLLPRSGSVVLVLLGSGNLLDIGAKGVFVFSPAKKGSSVAPFLVQEGYDASAFGESDYFG